MKRSTLFILALFLVATTHEARAQATIEIGPRVGYEIDNLNELIIGADARIGTAALPVVINPAVDYYFVDGASMIQFTGNALYEFGIDNELFTPYAGAGVAVTRYSVDVDESVIEIDNSTTDVGLNVVGGARFGFGNLRPFVQAQLTFGDIEPVSIVGGVLFSLGG